METEVFIEKILKKIDDFKKKNINEAQTKEWLIKPFFESLDWSFSNPDEIIPEDDDSTGKKPDYGFYLNNNPKFYVEAKAINNNLEDIKMITDKINYCNNSNVPFLIITNGINYKIYYIGLKGTGNDKLLQEFSIIDVLDDKIISMLTKNSFETDKLLKYAKNVFIYNNIKSAIETLFQKPPKNMIDLINNEVKVILGHKFGDDEIKSSLLNFNIYTDFDHELIENPEDEKVENNKTIKWTIDYQFNNGKWKNSLELYKRFISAIKNNGISLKENPTKFYIGIIINDTNFLQVHGQKSGLKVWIITPFNELSEQDKLKSRDVTNIGHWGMGNTECFINNDSDFDWIINIIKKTFIK